ncbi:MAG: NAD(P)/FAD-dependent oxidoreductase [Panacagrimonas sp.]
MSIAGDITMSTSSHNSHGVVVVGGGAGGATVAALLMKQRPDLDLAIIEPSEIHWYQPAWTLVGAGCYDIADTGRPMGCCLPKRARWIKARVSEVRPEAHRVLLEDEREIEYGHLVVAAGLQQDWKKIEGLEATLGRNEVTSNYRHDLAPYTWECVRSFAAGRALFTQPATPIKCPGAPQKILYLAAHRFRARRVPAQLSFCIPGHVTFGVPFYAKALDEVVAEYGITARFGHALVAVDGPAKRATFEVRDAERISRVELPFDLLHVVPPQSAPDFIKQSSLADGGGWLSVDRHTLRHTQYANVFGLGDCTTTPNSKTAAAVRAQAPVVAQNLLSAMQGSAVVAKYDGYASCPLTTSVGRVMLAEFSYDGVITPSFPLDPRVPRRAYWHLKKSYLPSLYWGMLEGKLGPDWHRKRDFPEAVRRLSA